MKMYSAAGSNRSQYSLPGAAFMTKGEFAEILKKRDQT